MPSTKTKKKPATKTTSKKRPPERSKKPDVLDQAEASVQHSVAEIRRESETRVRRRPPGAKRGKPMVIVDVPTKIGACCAAESSRFAIEDVAVLDISSERAMLAATNGRMLALVETGVTRLNDPGLGGLTPTWIPKTFAKPTKDGPRQLRLVKGEQTSLFGVGNTWVDDDSQSFREQVEAGAFPPMDNLLPSLLDQETVCVTLNAELLLKLAQAINDPDHAAGITLFVPAVKNKCVDKPIAAVGTHGVGVIMPAQPVRGYHGAREAYSAVRSNAERLCEVRPTNMAALANEDESVFNEDQGDALIPDPAEREAQRSAEPDDDGSAHT